MGSCTAIYVQRRNTGVYWVWRGSTQVNHEPDQKPRSFIGEFVDRGSALCAAHDGDNGTSDGVIELPEQPPLHPLTVRLAQEVGITDVFGDGLFWQSHGGRSVCLEHLHQLVLRVAEACAQRCDEVAAYDLSMMSPRQAVECVATVTRGLFKEQ